MPGGDDLVDQPCRRGGGGKEADRFEDIVEAAAHGVVGCADDRTQCRKHLPVCQVIPFQPACFDAFGKVECANMFRVLQDQPDEDTLSAAVQAAA